MELQDEIKSVIERFMNETGRGVKYIRLSTIEGIANDNSIDFSVLVELE